MASPLLTLNYSKLSVFPWHTKEGESKSLLTGMSPPPHSSPSEHSGDRWRSCPDFNCLWQNRASAESPFRGGERWKRKTLLISASFVMCSPNLSMISTFEKQKLFIHREEKLGLLLGDFSVSATRTEKCPEHEYVDSSHPQVISEEFMIYYMLPLYWSWLRTCIISSTRLESLGEQDNIYYLLLWNNLNNIVVRI